MILDRRRIAAALVVASLALAATLALAAGSALSQARSESPEREPLAEYRQRRERLAGALGGVIVLFAAPVNDLVEFQQDDNFYYLTGFDEPEAILMLDSTGGSMVESLFLPPRDLDEERWTGEKLGPGDEAAAAIGIDRVLDLGEFESHIREAAEGARTVFTQAGDDTVLARLERIVPDVQLSDVQAAISRLRLVKAPTEIALIEKAVDITLDAHRAAAGVIAPGAWEYQVEAAIEYEFRWNGAQRPAFPSIVGSGPFSTILHYDRNSRRMQEGDLVVVDIGAEYGGYAADVTRTYPVNGRFTVRQREIYEIVLGAQRAALAAVRPGATLSSGPDSIHTAARDYIDSRGYGEYFIHGTSHYLGLYVHDVGSSRAGLEPNMVLTVEPGIYIPEENIGVRIEDDVVVTEDGYRLLSDFPREVDEIEALMAERAAGRQTERQTNP